MLPWVGKPFTLAWHGDGFNPMMLDALHAETRIDRTVDVVVVGAGPAGVAIAHALAGTGEILLVEAGGGSTSPWLLEGDSSGVGYDLTSVRARQLGGSSALWAGYCAAFDQEDFDPQSWLRMSGWPIEPADLLPFYHGSAQAMDVTPDVRRDDGPGRLQTGRWTFSRQTRRFADDIPALAALPGVDVLFNANVVMIALNDGHDSVRSVSVRTAAGRSGVVLCRTLVLACGAIETPRLLLASNQQIPDGLGNASGLVGRCFMEHPHRILTGLRLERDDIFERSARRMPHDQGHDEMLNFGVPASLRRQLGILNARAHAFRFASAEDHDAPMLGVMMEQAPHPSSRITLSTKCDRVGMPLACVDWHLHEVDHVSFAATAEVVGAELEGAGLARVENCDHAAAPIGYCCHPLGTTRMADNPADGVTDRDCRVHQIDNLFIAGGSLFPTSSWANPTFMVLALALRLAHRLTMGPAYETCTAQPAHEEQHS